MKARIILLRYIFRNITADERKLKKKVIGKFGLHFWIQHK